MSNRRIEYFIIGLLVGGVVGLLAGILVAPDRGVNVRRRLADEAARFAGVARHLAERADEVVESLGARIDHYLGKDEEVAWRKVHEIRQDVRRYSGTIMSP
jgi:gas vesicle protein